MQKLNIIYLGTLVSLFFLIGGSLIGQHNHQHGDHHHHHHDDHHHMQVKVNFSSAEDEQVLQDLGISSCDVTAYDHEQITFMMGASQLKKLEESTLDYKVLIEDIGKYYSDIYNKSKSQNKTAKKTNKVANGFGPGSLANYYTYDEIVQKLDEITSQYPNIASQKINVGTTLEGNTIWAIKISDNPNADENEPVAYYDALHHSNEYNSMATLMNYLFWMVENYSTNPKVNHIINNRELYFVPVVNVDGYKSNEAYYVNTGVVGGQRKNNRKINNVIVGVDLNRNYSQGYNIVQNCSSPTVPTSGTYPGTSAFSEPESRAIRDFTAQINPQVAFSCHAGASSYLMPYGYSNTVNDVPDFKNYSIWGSDFLSGIDSYYGNTFTQLGYISCGTTRSYLHSTGTFAWTPELGRFYSPTLQELYDNVDIHIEPFLYQAYIAGGYADVKSHEVTTNVVPGQSFDLSVTIQNKGVGQSAGPVTLELVSTNPYFSRPPFVSFGSIAVGTESTRSITSNLGQGFTGDQFDLTMVVYQDGIETTRETIIVQVGQKNELFSDNAESGDNNWTFNGNGIEWKTTTLDAYSGNASFCDSPGRFDKYYYENNTNNNFSSSIVNLSSTQNPVVSFASKWSLRQGAQVDFQMSSNGGSSWTTIESFTGNQKWKFLSYQIPAQYRTSNFKARFVMVTPSGRLRADGFYFDDFNVSDYGPAVAAVCDMPSNLRTLSVESDKARVAWDLEAGAKYLIYVRRTGDGWFVYENNYTSNQIDLLNLVPGSQYTVAVRATCSNGLVSNYSIEYFNTPDDCATAQNLTVSNITQTSVLAQWDAVVSAERYLIEYREVGNVSWTRVSSNHTGTSIPITGLTPSTDYEWAVRTYCTGGIASAYVQSNFRTSDQGSGGNCNLYNITDFESSDIGIWNDGGNYARIYRSSSFAPNGEWSFYITRSGEQATLFSDVIPTNSQDVNFEFNYNSLNGGTGNKFYLEGKINNGTWTIIKTFESLVDYNRRQVTNWQTTISGASINNLEFRFRADFVTTDYLFVDDIKIELCGGNNCIDQDQDGVCADSDPDDNDPCVPNSCSGLTCENTITSTCQYEENFTSGFGLWQQSSGDDLDWTNKEGRTSSSNTGPSGGLNGGKYIYIEASSPNYPSKTAILESACIDLTGDEVGVFFYTHMYGSAMGTLYFEVSTVDNQWETVMTFDGNQGNEWKYQQYIFPASLLGQSVKFRFRGVTGSGWSSDIAVDRFKIFCNDDFAENADNTKSLSQADPSEIKLFPNPANICKL